MTHTLFDPIKVGVGHAMPSWWAVHHFVFFRWGKPIIFHNWVPQATQ